MTEYVNVHGFPALPTDNPKTYEELLLEIMCDKPVIVEEGQTIVSVVPNLSVGIDAYRLT